MVFRDFPAKRRAWWGGQAAPTWDPIPQTTLGRGGQGTALARPFFVGVFGLRIEEDDLAAVELAPARNVNQSSELILDTLVVVGGNKQQRNPPPPAPRSFPPSAPAALAAA